MGRGLANLAFAVAISLHHQQRLCNRRLRGLLLAHHSHKCGRRCTHSDCCQLLGPSVLKSQTAEALARLKQHVHAFTATVGCGDALLLPCGWVFAEQSQHTEIFGFKLCVLSPAMRPQIDAMVACPNASLSKAILDALHCLAKVEFSQASWDTLYVTVMGSWCI